MPATIAALVLFAALACPAASLPAGAEEIVIREALVLKLPRGPQRSALAVDPVEAALASGAWRTPRPGDKLALADTQTATWAAIKADANGWFTGLGDAYLYARVPGGAGRTMILDGLGDSYVFVNGEPRMGGKYAVKETYEAWEPRFDYGQVPDRAEERGQPPPVPLLARPDEGGPPRGAGAAAVQRARSDPARLPGRGRPWTPGAGS